jgi:cyclase
MRIIARLDVKSPFVVKPVFFEGLRKVGNPKDLANKYYKEGADEIFLVDIVSSLYRRSIDLNLVADVSHNIFVPFAVGGGIQTVEDAERIIHSGADKIIINTAAISNPTIIEKISARFGAQSVVVHIQAKRWNDWYECYTEAGRNRSGREVLSWAREAEECGAGELLLSVVNNDGAENGFDLHVTEQLLNLVNIPVVVGSGAGKLDDIRSILDHGPSGVAIATLLHYNKTTISDVKSLL